MRWRALFLALPLQALWWTGPAAGQAPPSGARPAGGIQVWDTGRPGAKVPADLAGPPNWTLLHAANKTSSFRGDAVLSNGRVLAVLRKREAILELFAVRPDGPVARARLRLQTAAGEPAVRLERISLVENGRGAACLGASFVTAAGHSVGGKFRLKRGDVAVQVEPRSGAARLRLECPGRFVVLPDFFAADLTLDATRLPLSAAELPGENLVLHLAGQGEAIALCVFEGRRQDVKFTLSGQGGQRQVTGSEVAFEGKKVWVALLETPHLWHARDLSEAEAGKVVALDWHMPFPAEWRVDFSRSDDLTDSWEMLLQDRKGGAYRKPSWIFRRDIAVPVSRERWNSVLGNYHYPCWSDPERRAYLQPLASKALRFQGPALIYPIGRVRQTPTAVYTVMDVMRNTLGDGPCEHLLDLEGQKAAYRGKATCTVRDTLDPIYEAGRQKAEHARVDRTLDEGLTFITHVRGRITHYVTFGHKLRDYLAAQRKAHPELADFLTEMDRLAQEIDARVAAHADKIKTPEHVARMNADFRKNVLDYDGPGAAQRCRDYTFALTVIGAHQDQLVGECRWVVKALRQRAGLLMAQDPRVAPIAAEIRARTQAALRNPAGIERSQN
jgi:hypothetical protein